MDLEVLRDSQHRAIRGKRGALKERQQLNLITDIQDLHALSSRLVGLGFPISRVGRLISKNVRVHLDVRTFTILVFMCRPDAGLQEAVALLNMAEEQSAKARSLPAAPIFVSVYSDDRFVIIPYFTSLCTRPRHRAQRLAHFLGVRLSLSRYYFSWALVFFDVGLTPLSRQGE